MRRKQQMREALNLAAEAAKEQAEASALYPATQPTQAESAITTKSPSDNKPSAQTPAAVTPISGSSTETEDLADQPTSPVAAGLPDPLPVSGDDHEPDDQAVHLPGLGDRRPKDGPVQFGFRCPRDLKREVERVCYEHELTIQEFGQTALRRLLDEYARQGKQR